MRRRTRSRGTIGRSGRSASPAPVPSLLALISWPADVQSEDARVERLLRLEDVEFAHQVDQRLCRTLITLQGLVLRDLDHGFRIGHLALLPLHPDRDRLP